MGHLGLHNQNQSARATTEDISLYTVSFLSRVRIGSQWQSGLLRAIITEPVLQPSINLLVALARCVIS